MLHGRFADPDTTPYTSLMSSPLDSTPTQKITASVTVNVTRNGAFISSDFKTSFEFCFSQFFSSVFCRTARPLDKFILKRKLFEGPLLLLFTFFLGVFCLAHTKSNLYSAFYLLHSIAQTFILIAKSFRTITLTLFGLLHCRGQSDYGILRRHFQNALKNSRDMRVPY